MVRNTVPLLQLSNLNNRDIETPRSGAAEIEMDDLSSSKSMKSTSSAESEEFKKFSDYTKAERFSLLIPIISILISIYVIFEMVVSHGPKALLICRLYSLYSIIFLILTFSCMLWNVVKISRSGHFRLGGSSRVSKTIKLFIYFMTLVTIVGYYNRFSHMRVFWKYDFVLNYTNLDLELPIDVFCVSIIIIYLLFQTYYAIIIAPRIGVTIVEKSLFGTTLFVNALQKWLLETMLVNSEVCEQLRNQDNSRCQAFVHYHTGRENLTQIQNDLYATVESNASLTYTCTLELFIGMIALLLYLPSPVHKSATQMMLAAGTASFMPLQQPPSHLKHHFPKWITGVLWGKDINNKSSHEKDKPDEYVIARPHWVWRWLFYLFCLGLALLPLYIIYVIPVISVDEDAINHQNGLLIARLAYHSIYFSLLIVLNFIVYRNCELQPILEEPDLIILVIASFIIAIKLLAKSILQIVTYFTFEIPIYPIFSISMNAASTIFEILSFFIFIHFTQKFFTLGHKSKSQQNPIEKEKQIWLHMFPTRFLGLYYLFHGIIGFAMYYSLNRLHIPFKSTGNDILDNALSIVHSLYPTTTLYNMTMALCYGHIVEQFHDMRLYDFKKQKEDIKGTAEEVRLKLGQH